MEYVYILKLEYDETIVGVYSKKRLAVRQATDDGYGYYSRRYDAFFNVEGDKTDEFAESNFMSITRFRIRKR